MNPIAISVTPSSYARPAVTITNVHVRVMNVVLFKSVNLNVTLMAGKDFIDVKTFLLEGDDYTNWANDDNYIINYALTKLGLSQSAEVTPNLPPHLAQMLAAPALV